MWASRCLLDNNRSIKIVYDSYLLVNNWLGSGSSVIFCTGDTKTDTDIYQPLKSGSMCVAINLDQLKIPCSSEIDDHRFGYLALPSKTTTIILIHCHTGIPWLRWSYTWQHPKNNERKDSSSRNRKNYL